MILANKCVFGFLLFLALNDFTVSSLKIPGLNINCSPRSFSITAPCQETCAKPKPKLCIRKPGCYCSSGIFDPIAKACVDEANCDPANAVAKASAEASGGGGIHIHAGIGGSGSGGASGGSSSNATGEGSGGAGIHASIKVSGGIVGFIKSILGLPARLVKGVINLAVTLGIKNPLKITVKGVSLGKAGAQFFAQLSAKNVAGVVGIIKGLLSKIGQLMVSIGVLQGRSVEDIMMFIQNLITKIVNLMVNAQVGIATGITGTIQKLGSGLKLPEIRAMIENLPVIKGIVKLIAKIRLSISTNFKDQISELKFYIQNLINQHGDFFKPIFNRISASILIISNSVNAIIDGKLNECPGIDGPDKSPSGSLQRRLHIAIGTIRVTLLKHLGFKAAAAKAQAQLDGHSDGGTLVLIKNPYTEVCNSGKGATSSTKGWHYIDDPQYVYNHNGNYDF